MKKFYLSMFLFLYFLFPSVTLAYSDKVVLGGENIGIQIKTPGVLVVGFYKVNGAYLKGTPEIKIGDYILKVGDTVISSVNSLSEAILQNVKDDQVKLTLKRNEQIMNITMPLQNVDGIYKTGLYVKESITGLGTLTYIDPDSKIYGALGHEILESNSLQLVEVKTGHIFESPVTSIRKSTRGNAGEKNAEFHFNKVYGSLNNNTRHGIYGIYEDTIPTNFIPVAKTEEIKIGEAEIYTVLNGQEKKSYKIDITSLQEYNDVKNISFTVTDDNLINTAGGIVQGMSGSPIVQNGKIIGAVTHVITDNPITGYGIFITTMLETGDNLLKN